MSTSPEAKHFNDSGYRGDKWKPSWMRQPSPEAKQAAFDEFVAKQDKNHPQWDKCAASVTSYRAIAACFFDAGYDATKAKLIKDLVKALEDAMTAWKLTLNRHEHERCGCLQSYGVMKFEVAALTGTGEKEA